jgi:hypothetical protein
MVDIQRIWRVGTGSDAVEVSMAAASRGRPQVGVKLPGGAANTERTFDLEVAQAIAQAILEACEISSALTAPADAGAPVDGQRAEVRVP